MIRMFTKKRNKKGFTLIELVVVIAILGILAALAIPRLGASRDSAKIAAHNANVSSVKSAAAIYLADNQDTAKSSTVALDVSAYMDGGAMPTAPVVRGIPASTSYTVYYDADGDIVVYPKEIKSTDTGNATLDPN